MGSHSETRSATMQGNQCAAKLKDFEIKREAYRQYCAHIAKGKSQKSWCFVHPTDPDKSLTWQTLETYMKNEPNVFNLLHKEVARCQGYQIWEQVVEDSARGDNKEANTASLQMLMRNKFDWDKQETKDENSSHVQSLATNIRSKFVAQAGNGDSPEQQAD